MAPPPITPSPHRFLKSKQNNSAPKPSSSLRFQNAFTQPSSSQQFAPTPRFNSNLTQKTTKEDATLTTQLSSPLSWRPHRPPHLPANNKEDIEEPSSDQEDAGEIAPNNYLPAYPSSKRRRPNPPETESITISSDPPSSTSLPTSPPTTSLHPTIEDNDEDPAPAPPSHHTTPAQHPPRFVLPHPKPTSDLDTSTIPSRPPLILPPRSPTPPPAALPAFFSPQRRGQKYIPGGMAATVRDWIIEAGQLAHNQRSPRDGEWDTRFRVGERVEGVGILLVREWGKDGARGWVLCGVGKGEGDVEVGRVVGVREPIWDVEVGGEKWRVAVGWGVVDG